MHTKFMIRPYKLGSKSAKDLAIAMGKILGYKVWRLKPNSIPRRNTIVINWGNGVPYWRATHDLNSKTEKATNKLLTFKAFSEEGVFCPEWTQDKSVAQKWINSGKFVVARKMLTGNSGKGIVLCHKDGNPLPNAPLYTLYKPKRHEYRAHVVKGQVIEVVQKKKKKGVEADTKIRNHGHGWVFCRDNIIVPYDLHAVAISAVCACDLDFGAVDIIWNEKENRCYALEVNTAPGIEGTTVLQYAKAFAQ